MSRAAPPNGSSTMLPNAPPMLYPYDLGYKFNASMAIIVVVLVTTFFFMALFILYLRRCNMGAGRGAVGGGGAALQRQQQQQRLHHHGIEPEVLAKFPLIRYASIKAPKKGKAGVECAVCLLQFEDNEKLRLLPPCGHLFHAECIDMWLQTHSTCPLCRRNLDGGDSASGHLQRALSAVVNSFRRDSNSNSLAEGRAAAAEADLEAHEEDEAEVGSQRHREIVRTLSKNSESFKMAAHDQELRELREKLRATSARFTKDTDPATRESFSRFKSFLSFRTTAPPTIHHSQSCTLLVDDNDAEFESTKTQQPKEAPADDGHDHPSAALRRSVSDGESFSILQQHKLWMGESSTPSSNSINPETNNRPAFRAFARRSLKWLVGIKDSSSSAASNNGSEENQTGLMQQQQVEK